MESRFKGYIVLLAIVSIFSLNLIAEAGIDDSFDDIEPELIGEPPPPPVYRPPPLPSSNTIGFSCKSFTPQNDSFKKFIGTVPGYSIDIYLGKFGMGVDVWEKKGLKNASNIKEVSSVAFKLTFIYPFSLTEYFHVYGGGGGRFEQISIKTDNSVKEIKYGNNLAMYIVGAKIGNSFGLDINYNSTFAGNRTNYDIITAGIFWAF